MIKNIYLIGLDHQNQILTNLNVNNVEKFIMNIINTNNIDLLAEEWNFECAEQKKELTITILKQISDKLDIPHINCEMTILERNKSLPFNKDDKNFKLSLRITGASIEEQKFIIAEKERIYNFPVREAYWLEKILNQDFNNCIFICGSEHNSSFKKLLESCGINCIIQYNEF